MIMGEIPIHRGRRWEINRALVYKE